MARRRIRKYSPNDVVADTRKSDGARARLKSLGYTNLHVLWGDGTLGWPEHAPYDAIVVDAGGPEIPAALRGQLAVEGRLVMPIGASPRLQRLVRETRTADEVMRRAGERGALVLEGRCHEGRGAPPFWPWTQVLRGWLDAVGEDAVRTALGRRWRELLPLLPELDPEPGGDATAAGDPAASRFALFDAIGEGLRQASRARPMAVLFDDLPHHFCVLDARLDLSTIPQHRVVGKD